MRSGRLEHLIAAGLAWLLVLSVAARAGSIFDDDWKPPVQRERPHQELPPAAQDSPADAPAAPIAPATRPAPERPAPDAPNPPAHQPAPTPPPPAAVPEPAPALKTIPSAADRARSRKLLKEAFAEKLKDTSPRARRELAATLLEQVGPSSGNPADQYVLATAAIDAAEQGQSLDLAFRAIDLLDSLFGVDGLAAKSGAVTAVMTSAEPWSDDGANAHMAAEVEDQFAQENDFVDARHVLTAILRHAARSNDRALSARTQAAIRELDGAQIAWEALQSRIDRLKSAPQDPSANFAVGAYLCFVRGQWERGLPYLARGESAALQAVAVAERTLPADASAEAVAKVADTWWDLAGQQAAAHRPRVFQHAAALYQRAEPDLTGLELTLAKKRIASIGEDALAQPAARGKSFYLPSKEVWTTASFNVEAGKCYQITAHGAWRASTGPNCGPEGICPEASFAILGPQPALKRKQRETFYLGQHPRGALIARIGQEKWTFFVGPMCRFVAPVAGQLSFRINDTDEPSGAREGSMQIAVAQTTARWVNPNGMVEILARLDAADTFHITPQGVFWVYSGKWGRVGEHDGYYPTVINGIYWWPKWPRRLQSDLFPITELWPKNPSQFELAKVEAKRGDVKLLDHSDQEIIIEFQDKGGGSSQVGCVISIGKSQ